MKPWSQKDHDEEVARELQKKFDREYEEHMSYLQKQANTDRANDAAIAYAIESCDHTPSRTEKFLKEQCQDVQEYITQHRKEVKKSSYAKAIRDHYKPTGEV